MPRTLEFLLCFCCYWPRPSAAFRLPGQWPLSTLYYSTSRPALLLAAKPKRGSIVDSYQTVSVNCGKCGERLFRYKKKNGTKSNLVKCYIERIAEDSAGVLRDQADAAELFCPSCSSRFARPTTIRGMPALKIAGGKVRMTKK